MEGCWRRLKESRWKVLGGALALLFLLAVGATAQQHLGDAPVAIGVPQDTADSTEFVVLPGSPEGGEGSRGVQNDLLKTGLEDDITDRGLDDVPLSIPIRLSPTTSAVTGDEVVESSSSEKLEDLTGNGDRELHLASLAVKSVEILDSELNNPFIITEEEEEISGTENEVATIEAVQVGTPPSAEEPQVPQNIPSVVPVPQDTLGTLDATEQTGTPLAKEVIQPALSEEVVKTTDQAGPSVAVDGKGVTEVLEQQVQGGIPRELASAQRSSASVLEDTSSLDTESPEVLDNDLVLVEPAPPAVELGSLVAQSLVDTSSADLAPAEETTNDLVPPSGSPDVDAVQEGAQIVDPAASAEVETVKPETPLVVLTEEPSIEDIAENILRDPQLSDITDPESHTPVDDTASGTSVDRAMELSIPAVARAQVSQVLPTSSDAEVESVMAGLAAAAAAAPSAVPSGPPEARLPGNVNPSVPRVSETEPEVEDVPAPPERDSLAIEPTGFGEVLPLEAEDNVNVPLTQEVELVMIPEEVAAVAPENKAITAEVSAMKSEDFALVPGMIADDEMSGEVIDEIGYAINPEIPLPDFEKLEMFFVANDPQASRIKDEVLGKDVTEVEEQLPEDEVLISALQNIVPFSPATVEVPVEVEEAVEDVLQAEIEAAVEDFGVRVPEAELVSSIDTTAPVQLPVDDPAPVLDPVAAAPVPETALVLQPEVAPVPLPAPVAAPAPVPEAASVPVPEAAPVPEAVPAPVPEAASILEAAPVIEAAPAPVPEAAPVIEAAPAPVPEAAPVIEAAPAPVPEAAPILEAAPAPASPPSSPTDMYGAAPPPSMYSALNLPVHRPSPSYKPLRPPTSYVNIKEPKPEDFRPTFRPRPMYGYPTTKPSSYKAPTTAMTYGVTTPTTTKPRPSMYGHPTAKPLTYKAPTTAMTYGVTAPTTTKPRHSYKPPTHTYKHKPTTTTHKPLKISEPVLAILGRPFSLILPESHRNKPANIWHGPGSVKPRRPLFRLPNPFAAFSSKRRQRLQVPDSVVSLLNAPQPEWVPRLEPER